eukprot:CCRYP_012242-RC/>CCRYP_012242-RC protein AED:0.25 eAED:0.25 QI:1435/0.88/0.8/1/0.77/0.5/10/1334/884
MKLFKSKTTPDPPAANTATEKEEETKQQSGRLSFFQSLRSNSAATSSVVSQETERPYKAMNDAHNAPVENKSARGIEMTKMQADSRGASKRLNDAETGCVEENQKSACLPEEEEEERLTRSCFLCLLIWCAVPCAAYILLFTQMGYGELFYYTLSTRFGSYSRYLGGIILISSFLYYILDIDEWDSRIGRVLCFIVSLALFLAFMLWVLLVSNDIPYGIITMFAILNPLWLLMVKNLFYRNKDTRSFVGWLSGPLMMIAVLTALAFLGWVVASPSNRWNDVTKIEAAQRTGCAADFDEYPSCYAGNETTTSENDNNSTNGGEACFYLQDGELVFPDGCEKDCISVYSGCSNGLILWAGPILMSLSMVFLGFFCKFLRTEGAERDKDIFNFGTIWIFALCIMWASASLAGAAAGQRSTERQQEAVLTRIQEKYGDNLDIARGLLVVTCSPFIIVYLILSMINQMVRRVGINPCSQPPSVADDSTKNASIFTVRTNKHLTKMRSWDRARVLTYAIYWGVAYMILQVIVAKLTVVFLSWMIERTSELGLIAVTGITCAVGVIMFLLPPVPGVPVYLTLGIVLTARGYDTMGWVNAVLFSTAVGTGLKLFSSALQQKLIGENLSHFVKIRQFVGINSQLMRAMRLVLGKSGLSVPKVAILIGGPDWPTSVLCGIMKLSLFQIMVGTLPIVVLIFPTCLMGGLLYMASLDSDTGNPEIPWSGTAATICASFAAAVQFGSMIVAAYYLEQASEQRRDEVDAIEIDREVQEADERDEHLKKCYATATQWRSIPIWSKAMLVCAVICITTSCYLVQFFSSLCFVQHELTDSIYDNLDGNVANLFLPLGWLAVGLFFASILFQWIFTGWGKRKAKELINSDNATPILNKKQVS